MSAVLRTIDAAANRAREALRVMEDVARFSLNDELLCRELKSLRHDLAESLRALVPDETLLVAWRDTDGDVGAAISTDSELRRADVRQVAIAAGKRLGETLRTVEEFGKVIRPGQVTIESIRYRAYACERRLVLACGACQSPTWRLCVLLTESLCAHHSWEQVAVATMDSGADCIQLREKSLPDRELLRRAVRLVELARPRAVSIMINDRPDIARLAGAHGVHLGQNDLSVLDARRIAGSSMLIGVSCATVAHAAQAHSDGADYLGLGPMYPTRSKCISSVAGPELLTAVAAGAAGRLHSLAIGGIEPGVVPALRAAGCRGIAVSAVVCSARDPAGACRELLTALDIEPPPKNAIRHPVDGGRMP